MKSPFSDELISAYLDGELTAQEQEHVEAQLRDSADLRRMCDELRALRQTLQAMPVAEPPENLAERVLRQAERRMLSGHPDVDEISAAAASDEAVPSVPAPHFLRQWRVALVLTATLAASVLLTIWLPFRPAQKVAVVPPEGPAAAAPDHERALSEAPVPVPESVVPAASLSATEEDTAAVDARSMVRRAATSPPPGAPAKVLPATGELTDAPALGKQLEAERPEGMARAGGTAGGGQAAGSGDDLAPPVSGGFGGGAGYGTGRPVAPGMGEPGSPAGLGMGSMGGMSGVGRGTETAADSSPDYRFGAPGTVPGADAPPALSMEERVDEHQLTSSKEQLVGQLISSLDQQQILLVRLRMPQAVLQGCIDELQKATSVGVIVSKESVDALVAESVLSLNTLGDVEITSAVAASGLLEKLAASQNALVVDGSVEQIRQQLANLVAQPGVAVESAPAEPDVLLQAQMMQMPSGEDLLDPNHLSGRLRAEERGEKEKGEMKADYGAPPQSAPLSKRVPHAGGKKGVASRAANAPEQPARPSQLGDVATAEPAAEAAGQPADSSARDKSRKDTAQDLAQDLKSVYVFFRLRSETAPPAPASKPDDR